MDAALIPVFITAIVTILVALTGYLITYRNNVRLSQRTEQLSRINKQLSEFYGPLYSMVDTGNQAWAAFRSKYRPAGPYFGGNKPPPTDEELAAWRLWITTVFMPLNRRGYELVISKSDLLIEKDMPDCLKKLCAHVASYQTVLRKWENNDYSEHIAVIPYPREALITYSQQSFNDLKEKQARLIGETVNNRYWPKFGRPSKNNAGQSLIQRGSADTPIS
jgi:hypothetical protein